MFRFYHRTGRNSGYSNGLFFESMRFWWGVFLLFIPVAIVYCIVTGNVTSDMLILGVMVVGILWGWSALKRWVRSL